MCRLGCDAYARRGMLARFDDLRTPGASGFELADPIGELRAGSLHEVVPVLTEAVARAESGEWVAGYVTYEAAAAFDTALATRRPSGLLAWFGRFATARPSPLPAGAAASIEWHAEVDEERYRRDLATIAHHLRHGDTYQVNHTFRLRARAPGDALAVYADLCRHQRGAHHAYLEAGELTVACASPELFLRVDEGVATTAPMKGTRPRGRWEAEDRALAADLALAAKDRAEHVMIVDLLRNDLGRVAVPGGVDVETLFEVEGYPTVWQMVSRVSARLRPGAGVVEAFAALFPCGSVTGAPKSSTMRLIRDLEVSDRGVYCGAVGLLAPPGSGRPAASFAVPIRTLVVDHLRGTAEYGVGSGVVHDSDPGAEWQEAWVKARVLTAPPPTFGLLETMRWEPAIGVRLLDRHLGRLRRAADRFGHPLDEEVVVAAVDATVGGDLPLRVRVVVTAEGRVEVVVAPLDPPAAGPVSLAVDDRPVDTDDPLLYHKTTRRERYDAAAVRHPWADQVVLWNPEGLVTETTVASIAVRMGGTWRTPPVADGLLDGVARAEALADGWVVEGSVTLDDLGSAEGLRVLNAVRGVRDAVLGAGDRHDR